MMHIVLPQPRLPRLAVLGVGHVGPVVARVAHEAGYPVSIAASSEPAQIALIAQVLAPGVAPRWAAEAVEEADLVALAIPLHAFTRLDPSLLAGKLVVDMMNYWPPVAAQSRARMRIESSRAASDTICRRKPRRRLPEPDTAGSRLAAPEAACSALGGFLVHLHAPAPPAHTLPVEHGAR